MVVFHFLQKYGEELKKENNILQFSSRIPHLVCVHTRLSGTQSCSLLNTVVFHGF